MDVKLYLIVALICASLMTNDVEQLFICHLYIFFGDIFSQIFLVVLFVFLLLSCKHLLCVLDTSPYQNGLQKNSPILWIASLFDGVL